jgi:hypothetical protein
MWFLVFTRGSRIGSRLMIRSLFPTKVQENPLHNVLGKAEILFKGWFWWLIRGMTRSLEVLKAIKKNSQSVCLGWFVCGCCSLEFHEKVSWLLGTLNNYNSPLKLWGESYKGGLWFVVRLLKQSLGKVDMCYVHVFMFCQVGGFYFTKCKHELEFPWKSNVIMGSCGLKTLRRRKKANGLKRERSEWFDPLETSSLSLMKKAIS